MVPPEGMGHPKRDSVRVVPAWGRRKRPAKPARAGQGPVANTSRMPHTFGARSDKGVMSAPGEWEQILGRVLGREGTAGAPVPMAAEPPQLPTVSPACHHLPAPGVLPGQRDRPGALAAPTPPQPVASPSTGNCTPASGSCGSVLCRKWGVPAASGTPPSPGAAPVPGRWQTGPGWQEVVMLLLVLSARFQAATSLLQLN